MNEAPREPDPAAPPEAVAAEPVATRSAWVKTRLPIALAATLIVGTLAVSKWFGALSPEAREARLFLRQMPAAEIVEIHLEPYTVMSLVKHPVVIKDPEVISEVAALLRTAQPVSPNHPNPVWVAYLRVRTAHGDYGGQIEATNNNQGVLIHYASTVNGGWNYGAVRQDALGPVVERLAKQPGGK